MRNAIRDSLRTKLLNLEVEKCVTLADKLSLQKWLVHMKHEYLWQNLILFQAQGNTERRPQTSE